MSKLLFRRIGGRIIPILQKSDKSVMLTKPSSIIKSGSLQAAVEKTRSLRKLGKNNLNFIRARQWSTFYVKEAVKKLPRKYRK